MIACINQELCETCGLRPEPAENQASKKAVLFDFDWTLGWPQNIWRILPRTAVSLMDDDDPRKDIVPTDEGEFRQIEINDQLLQNRFAQSTDLFEQKLWLALSIANVDLHNADKNKVLIKRTADSVELREGVDQVLIELAEQAVPVAIISYGINEIIEKVLQRYGVPLADCQSNGIEVLATPLFDQGEPRYDGSLTPIKWDQSEFERLLEYEGTIDEQVLTDFGLADAIPFINSIRTVTATKGEVAGEFIERTGITRSELEVHAFGDGASDEEMLRLADRSFLICNKYEVEVKQGQRALEDTLRAMAGRVIPGPRMIDALKEML